MQHLPPRSITFRAFILTIFFAGCLSKGCNPELPEHSIAQRIYSLPEEHTLVISLDGVNLELVGHEEPNLSLSGLTNEAKAEIVLQTLEAEGTTQLSFSEGGEPKSAHTQVTILVPQGSQVEVLQESGSIFVHDFEGNLSIATISAPIRLDQIHGRVHAISRRGTIQVSHSQGKIDVLAESDEIRLTGLHGQITGTNIMGAITYNGMISEDDSARLETDHGAVTVQLDEGSGAKIEITSAGVRIVCTLPGIRVVQLVGAGDSRINDYDGHAHVQRMANSTDGEGIFLNAPILVNTEESAQSLMASKTIRETIQLARNADIALLGVGSTDPRYSTFYHSGYFSMAELSKLQSDGAVGNVCGMHFTLDGELTSMDLQHRLVTVSKEDLFKINTRFGVAGGIGKVKPIYGALRGGFINVLVTDNFAATALLELAGKKQSAI